MKADNGFFFHQVLVRKSRKSGGDWPRSPPRKMTAGLVHFSGGGGSQKVRREDKQPYRKIEVQRERTEGGMGRKY